MWPSYASPYGRAGEWRRKGRRSDVNLDACHDGGDGKPFDTELLDDAVDDDNESPCGTADLHSAATEERDEEAGNDGSYQSFFGADAGSDAECNGERQGDNAHDDACHEVGEEFFFIVIFQGME